MYLRGVLNIDGMRNGMRNVLRGRYVVIHDDGDDDDDDDLNVYTMMMIIMISFVKYHPPDSSNDMSQNDILLTRIEGLELRIEYR